VAFPQVSPQNREGGWVAVVLAQARAPCLSESFHLSDHPARLGEFSRIHQLSHVQSQIQIISSTQAMYYHMTNNMNQAPIM